MGCGQDWVLVEDFAFSWKHEVKKVEIVASLMVLVTVGDYAGSLRHGESGGLKDLEPGERVISEVAFYDEQAGRP